MQEAYFHSVSRALADKGIFYPCLVVDRSRLNRNIACLKETLEQGFDYRIVAKSLPSVPMLQHIMTMTGSQRLMCFHLPFLMHIVETLPDSDILLGKPMLVSAARRFYLWAAQANLSFDVDTQLQWLVDTDERLKEYDALGALLGREIPVNLEVDIGLHRGGFEDIAIFERSLRRIKASPNLRLTGLMGYEAHITKIPLLMGGSKRAEHAAKARYQKFVDCVEREIGGAQSLCLNMGGSTTYPLYKQGDTCNELATASALVKPSDFDVHTLHRHAPAAFIAAPVLKKIERPKLPMAKGLSCVMRSIGVLPSQACFIYGGNWLAKPYYPVDIKRVELFGVSSNQEMYALPKDCALDTGDYLFFRPTQSEAVLLQFGEIQVYADGQIVDAWSVFDYPNDSSVE